MALKDIGTFLSRYFVIGFYVPSFFGVVLFALVVRRDWVPDQLQLTDPHNHLLDANLGSHLLAAAILALPLAFALNGIWPHVFRFFRSFPYFGLDVAFPWLQRLGWRKRATWDGLFDDTLSRDRFQRNAAALELSERFPRQREAVQPTLFGNAVRAYEEYAAHRWGLDYATVWPRVETLFNPQEQALHDEVRTSLGFAVNLSLATLAVGVVRTIGHVADWRNVITFVASYVIFRSLAVDAVVAGGRRIRSSLDLHRLDLYDALGVQSAPTFSDAERALGVALSTYLLTGPEEGSDQLGRSDWARTGSGQGQA